MTEQQARQNGYSFTGCYKRFKDELQEDLKEMRKNGYKAYIVTVPDSKYSRGPISCGYSIYAEQKYFRDQRVSELLKKLGAIDARKAHALEKYNKELEEIDSDSKRYIEELHKLDFKIEA